MRLPSHYLLDSKPMFRSFLIYEENFKINIKLKMDTDEMSTQRIICLRR